MNAITKQEDGAATLLQDALRGLTAARKILPSKYFYDAEGSRLFEAICDLPEYHVTRTEIALLTSIAGQVAHHIPAGAALVEFGSGASVKTRLLLDAAPSIPLYVPIDISETALQGAAATLAKGYPGLAVVPLAGDFTRRLTLPAAVAGWPVVGFFPGSTIGNFAPEEAQDFLSSARRLLGAGSRLVLGADSTRTEAVLVPAYDDAQGVTAAFNKNLLVRLNRECGAGFDLAGFGHRAVWNEAEGRVEMHLVSLRDQAVDLAGQTLVFTAGETIHTESSYKYRPDTLAGLAEAAGWQVAQSWTGGATAGPAGASFTVLILATD